MNKIVLTSFAISCLLFIVGQMNGYSSKSHTIGWMNDLSSSPGHYPPPSYRITAWEYLDLSKGVDELFAIEIDRAENVVVTAGKVETDDNPKWLISKWNNTDLDLIRNVTLDGEIDKALTQTLVDEPNDVALGSDGSIYVVGFETNSSGGLTGEQWLVRWLDYNLNEIDHYQWFPAGERLVDPDIAKGVAVHWGDGGQNDRIFVVGYAYRGDPHPSNPDTDWVILCLNATDTGLKISNWPTSGSWPIIYDFDAPNHEMNEVAYAVAVDQENDRLVITGDEYIGGGTTRIRTMAFDLNADTWVPTMNETLELGSSAGALDVAVNPVGSDTEIYVVGSTELRENFHWLVQKYTLKNEGTVVTGWNDVGVQDIPDSNIERASGVDVAPDNKIIVVGAVNEYEDTSPLDSQWYVKVYDADGDILWAELKSVSSFGYGDELYDVAVDSDGNFTVVGDNSASPTDIMDKELVIAKYTKSHPICVDDDNIVGPWDGTPDYPYQNITSAREHASAGDTIFVYSGTYHEHVTIYQFKTLQGENRETTIIEGGITIGTDNVTVRGFTLRNATYGIWLSYCSNITLRNNTITDNSVNLAIYAEDISECMHDIDISNTVNGRPVYYWVNKQDAQVPFNAGYVGLVNCRNVTVANLNLTRNGEGITLVNTSDSIITENRIAEVEAGVLLINSSNNKFYHNNFVDYWIGVDLRGHYETINSWDNGYPSGGNYWSDYNGTDSGYDGIGDTPYVIDEDNTDNYPLTGIFSSFNTSLAKYVNVLSNSTIEGFEYFESNSTIKMYVSGEEGIGFCRASIPHILMNVSTISVRIDGGLTPVLYHNYTLYDNGTHRWIYFAYPHSTHEIDIIPEFPVTLILPLLMIFTFVAAVLAKKSKIRK